MYVCMCLYIHIYIQICTSTHVYTHADMYEYQAKALMVKLVVQLQGLTACVNIYKCAPSHMYTPLNTCMHMYICI